EELPDRVAAELGAFHDRVADAGEHLLEAGADLAPTDLLGTLLDLTGRPVDLRPVGGAGHATRQRHDDEACGGDPQPVGSLGHDAPPSMKLAAGLPLTIGMWPSGHAVPDVWRRAGWPHLRRGERVAIVGTPPPMVIEIEAVADGGERHPHVVEDDVERVAPPRPTGHAKVVEDLLEVQADLDAHLALS